MSNAQPRQITLSCDWRFRVKRIKPDLIRRRKRRILKRLAESSAADRGAPMLRGGNVRYQLAEKSRGTAYGGMAAIHHFVQKIGLPDAIDRHLSIFKKRMPYYESDHVLNLAYNGLCGATALQDIETRRNDEQYLECIGAERIPDPTTAGDFCRRFEDVHIAQLHRAIDEIRLKLWKGQDPDFLRQAVIDMDGTIVGTSGECKAGMDLSYKNIWGYHPLVVTLANTGEVLRLVNRGGNSNSARGAAVQADQAIDICRQGGFKEILLRGDTAFPQTTELDRWNADGIRFVFGMPQHANHTDMAENVEQSQWQPLPRESRHDPATPNRRRRENVKLEIVDKRGYKNRRLDSEWFTEVPYSPQKCKETYRLVILRKKVNITEQGMLFEDYRYFFYLSNLPKDQYSSEEIIYQSNHRCDQENVIAQLNQCRALHAPVDNLESNWAYMAITSLAWTLKAWIGLSIPIDGRWRERHQQERRRVIRMEHRTFVDQFVRLPAQIVLGARQLTVRLLSLSANLNVFNRWLKFALE